MSRNDDQKTKHLHELIVGFDTAMLVTHDASGGLRARPLSVAEAQGGDETLYFSTSIESPKVAELEAEEHVAVTFQDTKRYVSLSGTARVTQDRALIDRLWSEAWKVWFPKGKDDPTLAIVVVTPTEGEYWDQTGIAGVRYLFNAVKAYATGTKAPDGNDPRLNAKVPL